MQHKDFTVMGNAWSKDFGIAHLFLVCSRCDHLFPKWFQAKERDGKGFSMSYSAVKMPDLFKNLLRKLSEKREEASSRAEGRSININLFWLFDA